MWDKKMLTPIGKMNLLKCIEESLRTGKRFRKIKCKHNDGEPGVWMLAVSADKIGYVWVCYAECHTFVKDYSWLATSEILTEWEMENESNKRDE